MKRDMKKRGWHRMVNTITYIISTVESAYKFARREEPFDFSREETVEVMYNRNAAFIEDENTTYQEAHKQYVDAMLLTGWVLGPEDYDKRTMPDLVPYDVLSEDQKEKIAYRKAIVESARQFYQGIRADIESDLVNDMKGVMVISNMFKMQRKESAHC